MKTGLVVILIAVFSFPSLALAGDAAMSGEEVYQKTCSACHDNGIAGAPKLGDKAAWEEHMEQGKEHMYEAALNGDGAMPAKGGNPSLSDDEVKAAVDYMLGKVQD